MEEGYDREKQFLTLKNKLFCREEEPSSSYSTFSLMFLIRVDVDTKANKLGTSIRLVEKPSPVFTGPVRAALSEGKEEERRGGNDAVYYQRHPKELLGRLFG
ncbi:hypothetical protein Pcinc_008562 [Petrolisthes cinctipes]|nr:hypothetical protein Pcinc_008562 [Petrolisthes cinctipes]